MNTLCDPYYNMLVGNAMLNFIDLVIFGEMIEYAIKSGKIEARRKKGGITRKNEETQIDFLWSKLSEGFAPIRPSRHVIPQLRI